MFSTYFFMLKMTFKTVGKYIIAVNTEQWTGYEKNLIGYFSNSKSKAWLFTFRLTHSNLWIGKVYSSGFWLLKWVTAFLWKCYDKLLLDEKVEWNGWWHWFLWFPPLSRQWKLYFLLNNKKSINLTTKKINFLCHWREEMFVLKIILK